MTALFNNKCITDELTLPLNDRALQFGDGLFETINVKEGKPELLYYHVRRLQAGAQALNFRLPDGLEMEPLIDAIRQLLTYNSLTDSATIKLLVWRKSNDQRAYASDVVEVNTLLLVKAGGNPTPKNNVGFSQEVKLHYWKLSQFKTINALPYVMASRERDERLLDELILLNTNDHITECTSSNIFWMKEGLLFTPSLLTGCIAGVRRAHLIDQCKSLNVTIKEVEAPKGELLKADAVFSTNSQGIQFINAIDGVDFSTLEAMETIKHLLQ